MWILLVGAANTSQGHPVSKLLQQSLLSLLISSTKHTDITVTKMAPVSPLHQTGDDERYSKQNCPVRSTKSVYSKTSAFIRSTNLISTLESVLLSPCATCHFEHRPLQEWLQVCSNIILQESNVLATPIFKTSLMVFILTTLAPFLTGHLWGYCTFDRQSILFFFKSNATTSLWTSWSSLLGMAVV
jgi:hypothetical protein